MKKAVLALLALCSLGHAETFYTAVYEKTLSAAAGATSLQQPAAPTKGARLIAVQVYSSVAATFEIEAGGTATTTASTAIATVPLGQNIGATLKFFTDSNASDTSTNVNKLVNGAGATQTISFADGAKAGEIIGLIPRVANVNYTVRSSSITGDIKVTWFWAEE
jgi:hypothetical protein